MAFCRSGEAATMLGEFLLQCFRFVRQGSGLWRGVVLSNRAQPLGDAAQLSGLGGVDVERARA